MTAQAQPPSAAPSQPPAQPQPDWRATGARIDTLIDASSSGGTVARERAEELVRLVADLYGGGLERLLDILYEAGHLGDDVLEALAADELVSSLLVVHGLHPYDVNQRVERALESVRPYLGSHGGDVELLEVTDDDVVRLRLLGSCDGCPSSSVTLKLAVEGAIEAAAPEIARIEVEEAAPEPAGAVIPVASLRQRLGELDALTDGRSVGASSWQAVPAFDALAAGEVVSLVVGATPVLGCRVGSGLFAFVDRCARCENMMASAVLSRRLGAAVGEAVLRCPSCEAHYDVRRAGACLDDETLHLTPLPLLTDAGVTSVAVPVEVLT
jgi:Fe-S cluster biogenesis protein NfuA/nitrite reductase/ring-hydroxylating ferredoxin subunit